MRMRAALDLAPQHPGGAGIGGEQCPPGDLVHAIGADRPGANNLEMGFKIVHRAASLGVWTAPVSLVGGALTDRDI